MELFRRFRARCAPFLMVGLLFVALPAPSARAVPNRTIVLRAAGSGAALGAVAGLISYPLAKSTGTIFAGALVGALLGTAYGFYLVDHRDAMYQRLGDERADPRRDHLEALYAANESREAIQRLDPRRAPETSFAFPAYRFDF